MRASLLRAVLSSLALLAHLRLAGATPFALEDNDLEKRCSNPCGYYGQICCTSSQTCSTNSENQAVCVDSSGGEWQYYTTTYVLTETDVTTVTSTWSSRIAAPTATATSTCKASLGETACGNTCCGAAFMCYNDQCIVGSSIPPTATATPPVRGTSSGSFTVTQTAAATTTEAFIAPVGTDGATLIGVKAPSGGLSGGAIAGIVIGVIAGILFLLLLCACMCFRGALHGLLAILGLKGRKKDTTYVEERYSHHSHGGRPEGRTWFGSKPAAPDGEERKSKWAGLATIGIILGALALCLGLKRRRQEYDEKSDYTYPSSYYYYSDYYTSASSESSDRRTRDTRRSRRSRTRSRR